MRDKRGAVLFFSLVGILLMTVLAVEFSRDAVIEYRSSANAVHKLQAYYAAKAGVDISHLRIKLYYNALNQLGDSLGSQKGILDQIWQIPFQWPPEFPGEVSNTVKSKIEEAKEKSFMKSSYITVIEREEQKINLPLLIFPVEKIRQVTKNQILNLLKNKRRSDSEFSDTYSEEDLESLVNNIIDWIDEDDVSLNGGSESSYYEGRDSDLWPPQRLFYSMGELQLVSGMNEKFFLFLKDKLTLYAPAAIQVNFLSQEVFQALFEDSTDELFEAFQLVKEENGDFSDIKSFYDFLEDEGYDTNSLKELNIPLIFDSPSSFRIYSTGFSHGTSQSIEVVTLSQDALRQQFFDNFERFYAKKINSKKETKSKKKSKRSKKKTSTIVYWKED